jgi:hypothetical protein
MADAEDLKSSGVLPHGGSNPPPGTIFESIRNRNPSLRRAPFAPSTGGASQVSPAGCPGDALSSGGFCLFRSIVAAAFRGGRLSQGAPGDGFSPGVFDFLQPTLTLCIPRLSSHYTNAQQALPFCFLHFTKCFEQKMVFCETVVLCI